MKYTCKACGKELSGADVAKQTLAVAKCTTSHCAGPFLPVLGGTPHARPDMATTRTAVED